MAYERTVKRKKPMELNVFMIGNTYGPFMNLVSNGRQKKFMFLDEQEARAAAHEWGDVTDEDVIVLKAKLIV